MSQRVLKLATRTSPLAWWQANHIKQLLLQHHPELTIELTGLLTQGDQIRDKSLIEIGGKSLFVKELQSALIQGAADIAVHCVKDMSVQTCPGLILAAIPEREDPRDVLIVREGIHWPQLPKGAIIGTSSPRRSSLLRALLGRDNIHIKSLRGNVDTRIAKLDSGEVDMVVLAAAGLNRLQLTHRIHSYFDPVEFIPAIGQGALAIECRADDAFTKAVVTKLNHYPSYQCVAAERAFNECLGGDCYTPLGAYATLQSTEQHEHATGEPATLLLRAMVADLEGQSILRAQMSAGIEDAEALGKQLAQHMLAQGAGTLLQKNEHDV